LFTLACKGRILEEFKVIVKPISFIIALVVSLPLLIMNPYHISTLKFITRVIASTIAFIVLLRIIGWRNILYGLRDLKVPSSLIWMIFCTIKFIPLFINEVLRMLLAREARIFSKQSLLRTWKVLSTIASEVVVKSYHRSWRFNLALEARIIGGKVDLKYNHNPDKIWCILLFVIAVYVLLLELSVRLWGII